MGWSGLRGIRRMICEGVVKGINRVNCHFNSKRHPNPRPTIAPATPRLKPKPLRGGPKMGRA
jgi:hypothetical protein